MSLLVRAQRTKFVFILGAGASAPYGLPVMRNFMSRARERFFRAMLPANYDFFHKSYEALMDFRQRCRGSSWAVNRDWDNIEELYTQADLLRLANPNSGDNKALCQSLAWAIWDVYRQVSQDIPNWCSALQNTRKQLGVEPVIITTNYDVLPEASLKRGGWEFFYPGFIPTWEAAAKSQSWLLTETDETPAHIPANSAKIIKLHGSVNWFNIDDDLSSVGSLLISSENQSSTVWITDQQFKPEEFAAQIKSVLKQDVTPVPAIVPPMLGQMSMAKAIAHQWTAAIEAISDAKYVAIIGYSFPTTDAFMTRLLAEGLQHNQDVESIVICDQQPAHHWEPRLASIFNSTLRTNGKISMSDVKDARQFIDSIHGGDIFKLLGLI
jgi:NAD-dependent SIR2 family protein deacetylase